MITGTSSTAASTAATGKTTSSNAVAPGGKLGKEEFLKLLVAQLRNQDPANPADGKEMAAQLAQFSSVEQLQNISATLTDQQTAQAATLQTMSGSIAMGTIGKTVLAAGDQFTMPSSGSASVTFDLSAGGAAKVRVLDAQGRTVATRDAGYLNGGRHTLDLGAATAGLPAGTYHYVVDAGDTKSPVTVQTYVSGRVDGVNYGKTGPELRIGDITVSIGNVVEVRQ